jgi:hypothetical protein
MWLYPHPSLIITITFFGGAFLARPGWVTKAPAMIVTIVKTARKTIPYFVFIFNLLFLIHRTQDLIYSILIRDN